MGDKNLSNFIKSSEKRSSEEDMCAEPVSKRLRRYKDELKLTVNKETEVSNKELITKKNCLRSHDSKQIIKNDSKTNKKKDDENNSPTKAGLRKSKKCDLEKEVKVETALSAPKTKSGINDKKQTSDNDNLKKNKYSTREKNSLSLHNIKKSIRHNSKCSKIEDKRLILPTKKGSLKKVTVKKETVHKKQTPTTNFYKKKKQSTQGNIQLIIGKKINKRNYEASIIKRIKTSRPSSKSALQYVTVKNTSLLSNITPEKQITLEDHISKNSINFSQDSQNTQMVTRSTSFKYSFVKNVPMKSRNKTITSKKEGDPQKIVNQENGQIPVKVSYLKSREGAKNNRTRRKNELQDDSLETSEINLVTDAPMSITNLPYYNNASLFAMDTTPESITFATNSDKLHDLVVSKNCAPHSIKNNQHKTSQEKDSQDFQNDFEFGQTHRGLKNKVNCVKTFSDLLFQNNELNISAGIQTKLTDSKSVESVISSYKQRSNGVILSDWSTSECTIQASTSQDASLPNVNFEEPGTTVHNQSIGPSSESSVHDISYQDLPLPNITYEESGTIVSNWSIGPTLESSIQAISYQDLPLPNVTYEEPGTLVSNQSIELTSESSIYTMSSQVSSLSNVNYEEPGTIVSNQSIEPTSESSIHAISSQDSSLPNVNFEGPGTTVNNQSNGPSSESSIHAISSQDSSLHNANCEEPGTIVSNQSIEPTSESSVHDISYQDLPLPNVTYEEPGTIVSNHSSEPTSEISIYTISSQDLSLSNANYEDPGTIVSNQSIEPTSENSVLTISSQDSLLSNNNFEETGATVNNRNIGLLNFHDENNGVENILDHNSESLSEIMHHNFCSEELFTEENWKSEPHFKSVCFSMVSDRNGIVRRKYREYLEKESKKLNTSPLHIFETIDTEIVGQNPQHDVMYSILDHSNSDSDSWENFNRRPSIKKINRIGDDSDQEQTKINSNKKKFMLSKFVKKKKNKKIDKAVKYSNNFRNSSNYSSNSNKDSSKTIINGSFERRNVPEVFSLNGSEEVSAIAVKSNNYANGTDDSEIKALLYKEKGKGERASKESSESQNDFRGFDCEISIDTINEKETEIHKKRNIKESCILNSNNYISGKDKTLKNIEIEPKPITEKCALMLHNQNDLLNTNHEKFCHNKDHLSVAKFSESSNSNVKCEIIKEPIYNSAKNSSHNETCITEDNIEFTFTDKARGKPTNHPNLDKSLSYISDNSSIVGSEIFTGDSKIKESNKKISIEKIGLNPNKISKENPKGEEDPSCLNKTCFVLNNSIDNVQNKSKSLSDNDASVSSEHIDLIDLNVTSNAKLSNSEKNYTLIHNINKMSFGKTEKIKSQKQSTKSLKISGSDHLSHKEENLSLDKSELLPIKIVDHPKDVNVSSLGSNGCNYKSEEINRKENVNSNASNCMDSASVLSLTKIQTKICPKNKNDFSVLSEQFHSIKMGKNSIAELCNEIPSTKNDNSSVSKHSDNVNTIVKCESIIKSNNLTLKEDVLVPYDQINYKLESKNKLPNKLLNSKVETIKNEGFRASNNNSHFEKAIKLDENQGSKENITIASNVINEKNDVEENHTSYSKQNSFFPSKCIQKFPSIKANKVKKNSLRKNKIGRCERMYNSVTAKQQKKILLKEYRKRISKHNKGLFNHNLSEGNERENKLIDAIPVKAVVVNSDYEEINSSLNLVTLSQEELDYSAGGLRCNQSDEICATQVSKSFKNTNVKGLHNDEKLSSANELSDECSINNKAQKAHSFEEIAILKPKNETLGKVKSQNEELLEKYFENYCIKKILTNNCKSEDHCKNIHDIPIGFLDGFAKEDVELLIRMVVKHSTLISTSFLFEVLCFFVQYAAQIPILSLSGRILSKIFMKSKPNKRYLREVSNYIFDALHDIGILRPEAMSLVVSYNNKFFSTCALESIYCIFEEWDIKSAVLYPIWNIIKPLRHRDGLSLSEEIVIKLVVEVKDTTNFDCIQFCAAQLLQVPETTLSILSNDYLENFIKKLVKVGLRKEAKRLSKKIPASAQITENNSHMDIPPTDSIMQEPTKETEDHIEILNTDHNTEIYDNILVAVKFKQYQQLVQLIIGCLEKNMKKFVMNAVFICFNEEDPLLMTDSVVSEFSRNSKFNKFSTFCSSLICTFILYFSKNRLWDVSHGFICLFEKFKLERYKLQEFIDYASPIRLALVYSEVYFYNGRYKESINTMSESFLLLQHSNYELKKETKIDYSSQQKLLCSYLSEYLNYGLIEFGAELFNLILEKQYIYSSKIDLTEYFEVLANHLFVSNKRDERPLDFYIALSKIKYFPLFGLTVRVLLIMAFKRGDWNTVTKLFDEALACGAYPGTMTEKFTIMLVKSFTEEEIICYLVEWFINFKKTYAQEYRSLYEYFSSNENETPTFSIHFKEENLTEFQDHKSLSIPPILQEVDESVEGCTVRLISVLKIVNLKLVASRENTLFIKNDMYFKAFLKKI